MDKGSAGLGGQREIPAPAHPEGLARMERGIWDPGGLFGMVIFNWVPLGRTRQAIPILSLPVPSCSCCPSEHPLPQIPRAHQKKSPILGPILQLFRHPELSGQSSFGFFRCRAQVRCRERGGGRGLGRARIWSVSAAALWGSGVGTQSRQGTRAASGDTRSRGADVAAVAFLGLETLIPSPFGAKKNHFSEPANPEVLHFLIRVFPAPTDGWHIPPPSQPPAIPRE